MKQGFVLLSAALLASGQGDLGDSTPGAPGFYFDQSTTFIPIDKQAAGGDGAYAGMQPSALGTGQLAHHAEVTVFPPQRWGRMNCRVDDVSNIATSTREPNCDKLEIEFVGASAVPPYAAQDFKPWTPFNQYPRATWDELNFRYAGFDSGRLREHTTQVTSSPPCLFTTVVAPGGGKVTMYVQDCALWRGWTDPRTRTTTVTPLPVPNQPTQVVPAPGTGGLGAQTMFDKLVIFLPWAFLAPNAPFPHLMVETQASFYLADEQPLLPDGTTLASTRTPLPAPVWTKFGPYRANTPYVIQAPLLALYSLQLREFVPGAPAQNIKINTIAGSPLDAISVTLFLGLPLQAGMKIVLTTSVGPVDADFTNPPNNPGSQTTAPPLAFPLAAANQNGLIWAVPGSDPINTFIPIGPACGVRAGSVNCCSQSTAQIMVPQVSTITYPEWFTSLVITLGPPGCVLPINRRVAFVIPKAYLGKNPSFTVTNAVQRNLPGFWAVQTFVSTSAEASAHFLQRYGGDIDVLAYRQGLLGQIQGIARDDPYSLFLQPVMAEALPPAARISIRDLAYGGTLSSYVVGLSAFQSVTFKPNTFLAGVQPQDATITITLSKGLTRLIPANLPNTIANIATDVTPYFITLFATAGTIRPNVGSAVQPIQVGSSLAGCANALSAMTTATSNLIVWFKDDTCISVLTADKSVLTFVLPGVFLFPGLPAGSPVKVDARMVPPMNSVAAQTASVVAGNPAAAGPFGALVTVDSAMLMGVEQYTTVADCSQLPNQVGGVNDIFAMTIAARCTLTASILMISPTSGGFLQCAPGATIQNAQNMITYIKVPEAVFDGTHYPSTNTNLPAPGTAWPQNLGLGGTPPIYTIMYGYMFSYPMLAVVVSYPPSYANLKALGVNPVVPTGYALAFIVRITRITTACSVSPEANPWLFCAVVTAPVVNPLFFSAVNPTTAGVPVESVTYGRWNTKAVNVACISTVGDGAVAAWYPLGLSPSDDDSDGAWYAFFALFAIPCLLLLCCLLCALLFLKKRKTKSCCPAVSQQYPVQEMYWVNGAVPEVNAPGMYPTPAGMYAPAGSPFYG